MIFLWLIPAVTLGFSAGWVCSSLWRSRKQPAKQHPVYPFSPLHGDDAARLAVEGDPDYDPDIPARWPFRPFMGE